MDVNNDCVCLVLVPTALSIEEQRLLESLDRLNERLKSKSPARMNECVRVCIVNVYIVSQLLCSGFDE